MKREFSAMALLFAGQFKSNLRCTACQFESVAILNCMSVQIGILSSMVTLLCMIDISPTSCATSSSHEQFNSAASE